MDIVELRREMPVILDQFPIISLVYLFGSRVGGEIGPMSDFDLAILCTEESDIYEAQARFQSALSKLLNNQRVDVVVLNRAPIELTYNIIASGEIIFQVSEFDRVEFEANVLGKYGDFLPKLREYKEVILEGGGHAKRVQRYRESLERTQRTLGKIGTPAREDSGGV